MRAVRVEHPAEIFQEANEVISKKTKELRILQTFLLKQITSMDMSGY